MPSSSAPRRSSRRHEVLLGRTLAACVHPLSAWQSRMRSFRLLLIGGYFAAGYVAVLAAMALTH
jgi:hypothetical protein